MLFRVMGAVEVSEEGVPLSIGGIRQRRLLCSLLVARGSVVSVGRLAEEVWDDHDRPTNAPAAIRSGIRRLRHALGDGGEVVVTRAPGYVLEPGGHQVDALRFEELIESGLTSGDARTAERTLREALRLWQGPAFEEFADLEWCQAESERLGALRLVGLEELHRVRLRSGAPLQIIPDLERDCAANPLHEPLWILLAEALWRAGRSNEALRAAHTFREGLAEATGLEPSSDLAQLEASILGGTQPADHLARQDVSGDDPRGSETEDLGSGRAPSTFLFAIAERPASTSENGASKMLTALARHQQLVADGITSSDGQVFMTDVDRMAAIFGSAERAIDCAVDLLRSIQSEPQPADVEFTTRIGIHTGAGGWRGGNLGGPAADRAASLAAAGHGNQILVSGETAMSLIGVDLGDTGLRFLGEHQLDGVARPTPVFAVHHPELVLVDSTLASSPQSGGNIPDPPSSFVGREGELIVLAGLLQEHRIVTVVGAGGVGKTRTAVEVSKGVSETFVDGCWLVELASVPAGRTVWDPIATEMRGLLPAARSFDAVVDGLRARRALILLDNCEHVIDSAAEAVTRITENCPGCVVLATSRQPLDLAGECVFELDPLPAGTSDGERSDAALLLIERAGPARLSVDDRSESEKVEAVVARLGGVPLAIELAAARLRTMTLPELDKGLDQQLSLLKRSRRERTDRHGSLAAAIDWSYQLLSPSDQRLLCQLSVFAGTFTEADATTVVGGGRPVVEGIRRLVGHSLLQRSVTDEHSTFFLLDSVRQFAAAELQHRDRADVERAHAEYFLRLAERCLDESSGPVSRDDLDPLLIELRTALERGRRLETTTLWTRLHKALLQAAQLCGRDDLEQGASRSALAIAELALDHDDLDVELLEVGARAAWLLGRLDTAIDYAKHWLEAVRDEQDPEPHIDALYVFGKISAFRWELSGNQQAIDELEALAATLDTDTARAKAYAALANLRINMFGVEAERAIEAADAAIVHATRAGLEGVQAQALVDKGTSVLGFDPPAGRALLEEGIHLAERCGELVALTRGLWNLSDAVESPVELRHLIGRVEAAAVASGFRSMIDPGGIWLRAVLAVGLADQAALQQALSQNIGTYNRPTIMALGSHVALESGDTGAARQLVSGLEAERNDGHLGAVVHVFSALRLAAFHNDLAVVEDLACQLPTPMDVRFLAYVNAAWTLEELDRAGADHHLLATVAESVAGVDTFQCRYLNAWTEEARNPEAASAAYHGALDRAEAADNLSYLASSHLALGRLALRRGDHSRARDHLTSALAHLELWPGRTRSYVEAMLTQARHQPS